MSMEAVVSKIAFDELDEKPSYDGRRVNIHVGKKVTTLDLDDNGVLWVNGERKESLPELPKKADKIVLY